MKRCIACGAPLWETPLLTLDNMPASAQNIPDASQAVSYTHLDVYKRQAKFRPKKPVAPVITTRSIALSLSFIPCVHCVHRVHPGSRL